MLLDVDTAVLKKYEQAARPAGYLPMHPTAVPFEREAVHIHTRDKLSDSGTANVCQAVCRKLPEFWIHFSRAVVANHRSLL